MNHGRSNPPDKTQEHENGICLQTDIPPNPRMLTASAKLNTFVYKRIYRLILWASVVYFLTTAAGQLFALLLVMALFYFVARLVFALAWRLFVGFVFVLIIILLII